MNLRMTLPVLTALCLLGQAPRALGQEAEAQLLRARHLEQLAQDPDAALSLYQTVVGGNGPPAALSQASIGTVRCLLALNRKDEAEAFAARLPPGTSEATAAAVALTLSSFGKTPVLTVQDAGSEARIAGFIKALTDEERSDQVLTQMGDLAEPYLIAAARSSTDPDAVRRALRHLSNRVLRTDPSPTASEFYASLDPLQEPLLCLEALYSLGPENYGPEELLARFPAALFPFLDRCIATEHQGIRELALPLVAVRDDEAALEFCREMVFGLASLDNFKNASRGNPRIAKELFREAFEGDHPKLRNYAAKSLDFGLQPELWLTASLHPDLTVRRAAFGNYPSQAFRYSVMNRSPATTPNPAPLAKLFTADQLVALSNSVVEVLESGYYPREMMAAYTLNTKASASEHAGSEVSPAYFVDPERSRKFQTQRDTGEVRGLFAELPFSDAHWSKIAAVVASGKIPNLSRYSSGENRSPLPPSPLHWLMTRLDETPIERTILRTLLAMPRDSKNKVHSQLLTSLEASDFATARIRILVALIKHRDESVAKWALRALIEAPTPEGRKLLAAKFVENGQRLFGPSRYHESLALLLFDQDTPETREDLARLLRDPEIDFELLETLANVVKESSWSRDDSTVMDSMIFVVTQHPSIEARREALEAIDDDLDLDQMFRILAQLGAITDRPTADDEKSVAWILQKMSTRIDQSRTAERMRNLWKGLADSSTEQYRENLLHGYWRAVDRVRHPDPNTSRDASEFLGEVLITESASIASAAARGLEELWRGPWKDAWIDASFASGFDDASGYDEGVAILAALRNITAEQRGTRRDIIDTFLTHDSHSVRTEAIDVVAVNMDVRAAKALTQSLKDWDPGNRQKAMTRLAEVRTYLEESARWSEAEGLGQLTPLAALLQQSRDEDPAIRRAAVRSLGALGDPLALPSLIEMLRSEQPEVRDAAQASIDRLLEGRED